MKSMLSWPRPGRARNRPPQDKTHRSPRIAAAQQHRLVFENAADAIFVLHAQRICFANRPTRDLLDRGRDELLGACFLDFVSPDDRSMLAAYYGRPEGLRHGLTCTFRIVKKNGERLWAQAAIVPVTWQEQPAMLHFLRNFSRLEKRQRRFQNVARTESIDSLACGFDHLLAGILGNVTLALMGIPPSDPAHERIRNIERYVRRCVKLTRHLLDLVREDPHQAGPACGWDVVEP